MASDLWSDVGDFKEMVTGFIQANWDGNDTLEGETVCLADVAGTYHTVCSVTMPLESGDVVRAQTDSSFTCTTWKCRFTITQLVKY